MRDNVQIFLPLILYGIAVVIGLCLCYLSRHGINAIAGSILSERTDGFIESCTSIR